MVFLPFLLIPLVPITTIYFHFKMKSILLFLESKNQSSKYLSILSMLPSLTLFFFGLVCVEILCEMAWNPILNSAKFSIPGDSPGLSDLLQTGWPGFIVSIFSIFLLLTKNEKRNTQIVTKFRIYIVLLFNFGFTISLLSAIFSSLIFIHDFQIFPFTFLSLRSILRSTLILFSIISLIFSYSLVAFQNALFKITSMNSIDA